MDVKMMIKTIISIEYDGFLTRKDLGQLLILASSYERFRFLEVKQPGSTDTYSCKKEKDE
jgi:hypothetical protein